MRSIPQFFWYFTKELIPQTNHEPVLRTYRELFFIKKRGREALFFYQIYLIAFSVIPMYLIASL